MRVLVTGGCGFIGSNFLQMFAAESDAHQFLNIDKLSYAANPLSTANLDGRHNYEFAQIDLVDYDAVRAIIDRFEPSWVFHFAAETHVDRSIKGPRNFLESNVVGTFNLIEACREVWGSFGGRKFVHVSTDEVFGELGETGSFSEETAYAPNSPYSASKASSDHFVRAAFKTYGFPAVITNCSNNYGPRQFPEKLIPLMILNAMEGKPMPVYGQGLNVRDWLYVMDHCRALWLAAEKGEPGETYCIGGGTELPNIEIVKLICAEAAKQTGRPAEEFEKRIEFVQDRPGHDFRYAIDSTKIRTELSWKPMESFETGLAKTMEWYRTETEWVEAARSGDLQTWIKEHYGH